MWWLITHTPRTRPPLNWTLLYRTVCRVVNGSIIKKRQGQKSVPSLHNLNVIVDKFMIWIYLITMANDTFNNNSSNFSDIIIPMFTWKTIVLTDFFTRRSLCPLSSLSSLRLWWLMGKIEWREEWNCFWQLQLGCEVKMCHIMTWYGHVYPTDGHSTIVWNFLF